MRRVAGIVPAAGGSARMGSPKALLDVGGRPFVSAVVEALAAGGCAPVLVVTAPGQDAVARTARAAGALVLENPEPGEGPITSLRLALSHLPPDVDAVAVLPVDHPTVRAAPVAAGARPLDAEGARLALPVHGGRRGHPVIFSRALFPELLDPALEGGARTVVHRHLAEAALVEVEDPGVLADIDTPGDYAAVIGSTGRADPLDAAEAAGLALDAVEGGASVASLLLVAPDAEAGRRLLIVAHPERSEARHGTLGSAAADARGAEAARAALADPRVRDGIRDLGEGREAYLEVRRPVPDLVIVGAGHIARPMARLGAELGFRVWVLDDRPDFATRERFPEAHRVVRADFSDPFREVPLHRGSHVLLVTRGHRYDYDCLVKVLAREPAPAYIGMIGSRRRVRATFLQLLDEGFARERLREIHAPVGLDIGAETPEEIAVAVAAELIKVRRGGTGTPLRDLEDVAERYFPPSPAEQAP